MKMLIVTLVLVFPLAACGGSDQASEGSAEEAPQVEAPMAEVPEDLQVVQVRVEGDLYLFSPETIQAGHPVRLVFDPAALPGCSKDVTVPDYQIAKFISAEDSTIEFTPESPGPIAVACSMDMYTGTLVAE